MECRGLAFRDATDLACSTCKRSSGCHGSRRLTHRGTHRGHCGRPSTHHGRTGNGIARWGGTAEALGDGALLLEGACSRSGGLTSRTVNGLPFRIGDRRRHHALRGTRVLHHCPRADGGGGLASRTLTCPCGGLAFSDAAQLPNRTGARPILSGGCWGHALRCAAVGGLNPVAPCGYVRVAGRCGTGPGPRPLLLDLPQLTRRTTKIARLYFGGRGGQHACRSTGVRHFNPWGGARGAIIGQASCLAGFRNGAQLPGRTGHVAGLGADPAGAPL